MLQPWTGREAGVNTGGFDVQELQEELRKAVQRVLEHGAENLLRSAVLEHLNAHGAELLQPVARIAVLQCKERLTGSEVEQLYGIKRRTLAIWRSRGVGPQYEKPGGVIYYPRAALNRFFESARVVTVDDPTPVAAAAESGPRAPGRSARVVLK